MMFTTLSNFDQKSPEACAIRQLSNDLLSTAETAASLKPDVLSSDNIISSVLSLLSKMIYVRCNGKSEYVESYADLVRSIIVSTGKEVSQKKGVDLNEAN